MPCSVLLNAKLHSAECTLRAGREAVGVWARGLALCASRHGSLHLSSADVEALVGGTRASVRRVTDRLVKAGLWEPSASYGVRVVEIRCANEPAFRFDLGESWSRSAYPKVKLRDGNACRYCGRSGRLSIDHLIPRCQGGGDGEENLVVACWDCNSRKRGRTPEQAGMSLRPVPVAGEVV